VGCLTTVLLQIFYRTSDTVMAIQFLRAAAVPAGTAESAY